MKRPGDAVIARYVQVTPRNNETTERLIRRFCKKVRSDGILKEFSERRYHVKKSQRRRKKRIRARFVATRDVRN